MINKIISSISENYAFSFQDLMTYRTILDWKGVSRNIHIPWDDRYIDEFSGLLNFSWDGLAMNPSIKITNNFLHKYHDLIEWDYITDNPSIHWNVELLEEFKDDWAWESKEFCGNTGLSLNTKLPWNEYLIDKYTDRWFWGELSCNPSLPWSKELLNKYYDRWTWDGHFGLWGLSINPSPVVKELLTRYFPEKIDHKYFNKTTENHTQETSRSNPFDTIVMEYVKQYGIKKLICCINITSL